MSSPLVRLTLEDGAPLYVRPERVTGVLSVDDRVTDAGAMARSVVYVGAPHLVVRAGRAEGQAWDTNSWFVRGTADQVVAALWPQEAQRA